MHSLSRRKRNVPFGLGVREAFGPGRTGTKLHCKLEDLYIPFNAFWRCPVNHRANRGREVYCNRHHSFARFYLARTDRRNRSTFFPGKSFSTASSRPLKCLPVSGRPSPNRGSRYAWAVPEDGAGCGCTTSEWCEVVIEWGFRRHFSTQISSSSSSSIGEDLLLLVCILFSVSKFGSRCVRHFGVG